ETQMKNLSSLLWWMKRVIGMRKQYKAFGRGSIKFLSPTNAKVLAFLRIYKDESILVIANLSRFSQAVELDLKEYKDYTPIEIFSHNRFPNIKEEPYLFTLGAHGYYWFLLQKPASPQPEPKEKMISAVTVSQWEDLFRQ